jgi:hypothetical protein
MSERLARVVQEAIERALADEISRRFANLCADRHQGNARFLAGLTTLREFYVGALIDARRVFSESSEAKP